MRERLFELFINCKNKYLNLLSFEERILVDYLLENGVIVPPCKVGDTVYCLGKNKILTRKVERIVIGKNGYMSLEFGTTIFESVEQIGKTVFLTREEAEKALKNKKGE